MPPPPTQVRRVERPHPSNGYGEPYSQDMRDLVIQVLQNGDLQNPAIQLLRQQRRFPSRYTIRRWQQLQQQFGHYRALQRNGNKTATVLRRHNLILIALYRLVMPKALHAEMNAFLYRANYGDPNNRFYVHSQI